MMEALSSAAVPVILLAAALASLLQRVDAFSAFREGAKRGLSSVAGVLQSLVVMLPAIHMLRASGLLAALERLLAPALRFLGIPPELTALILIRPLSGGGALAVGGELISRYGADTLLGRTAAVMLGSTETTFYTVSVYFGSAGVRDSRYAVPAALLADLAGFFLASLFSRLLWAH